MQKANYTVSAERQDYTYNRTAQGAAISVTAIGEDEFTVMYDGQAAVAQYTNAGTYTVKYTVSGNENYNDVSGEYNIAIAKAENVISTAGVIKTYTYNGTQITVNSGANATYGEVVYSENTFTNAGSYTVTLSVAESENYLSGSATVQVTVRKAAVQIGSSYQYTYNRQGQGAISVTAPDLTYEISFSYAGMTYDSAPLFTDAGIYTVSYSVKASQNYVGTNGTYTVTVAQATLSVKIPDVQSKEYDGDPLDTGVTVEGAFDDGYTVTYRCNGATIDPERDLVNAGTYVINYTVSGKNYETVSGTFTVTIAKAVNSINTDKVQNEYVYTGELITVHSGASALFGEVVYSDNTFTDAGEYNVKLFVAGTENYEEVIKTVTVTVLPAEYQESEIPEEVLIDPDVTLALNKTLANVALHEGFYWEDNTAALKEGKNVVSVYYWTGDSNYKKYYFDVTFTARKEIVTVLLEKEYSVKYSEMSSYQLPDVQIFGEGRTLSAEERAMFSVNVDTSNVNAAVGSTYLVAYTIVNENNPYFDVVFQNNGNANPNWLWLKVLSIGTGTGDNAEKYTIEDALNEVSSGTVIVQHDTAFAPADQTPYSGTGYYTVQSGVTLLVPYNSSYSTNTKDCDVNWEAVGSTPYVTFIVTEGTELSVQGKLIVNALIVQRSGTTSSVKGNNYGSMEVCENAMITLQSGAVYESIGFSYGGGSIVAESGSYVYELFNMVGYKGGTISSGIEGTVFPLNQYSLSGISCKLEIRKGSSYYAKAFTAALSNLVKVNADVLFISDSDTAFMQMTGTGGSIYKWIDESNGKIHFDIHADVQFHNMSVDLDSYALDTAGKEIPIPGNFKISVSSGTATIPSDIRMKLLPGAEFSVEEGAVVDVYGKLYSYGSKDSYSMMLNGSPLETWQDGNQSIKAYPYGNMSAVYRVKPTLDYNASSAALISIGGTVNVYSGAVFACEASGANSVAKISFAEGSVLSGKIKEDYSHIKEGWLIDTCVEVYFDTTFTARGKNGEVFEVGKTYLYGEGGWTVQ